MSGGVDSSVAALLLLEKGYEVRGVYMRNWSRDLPSMKCPWARDLADAKRVATRLGIPFEVWDFEKEYYQSVIEPMLEAYRNGETPNPDVLCNQTIKFDLFARRALEAGADYIATGHYARVSPDGELLMAKDENKDQTYFLYRVSSEALKKTIFPLGEMMKTEVKEIAASERLDVINKKESMGVCFVGEANIKEFLQEYLPAEVFKSGRFIDMETGETLGYNEGAIFYTIGQRHGLYIASDLPYYVARKDLSSGDVWVTKNLNNSALWAKSLSLKNVHSICGSGGASGGKILAGKYFIRTRHQAALLQAEWDGSSQVEFEEEQKVVSPGQSVVFYDEKQEKCLGGGICLEGGK
ncbi:tRNA 2-thiouridine(34) synthase MnmA [Candidatus Saccharibacteria bacterium]|nr:tRNA 2-thiouridine(34) synthase MnmA [Candidatus Saccharibacteria bacterium]